MTASLSLFPKLLAHLWSKPRHTLDDRLEEAGTAQTLVGIELEERAEPRTDLLIGRILLEITLKCLDALGLRHLILVKEDLMAINECTIVDALTRLGGRAEGLQHLTMQGVKGFDRGEVVE